MKHYVEVNNHVRNCIREISEISVECIESMKEKDRNKLDKIINLLRNLKDTYDEMENKNA